MGQSNSTFPLVPTQTNQIYKQFNYSRLIANHKSQTKANQYSTQGYFRLHHFQSLNGDDLLVRDRQNRLTQKQPLSRPSLKNITNLKLTKQKSFQSSRQPSINTLQTPDQNPGHSHKPSHVTFTQNQRQVFKTYIISKCYNQEAKRYINKITNYFIEQEQMENYVSNLVKMKQVLTGMEFYEDFVILQEDSLFVIERVYSEAVDFGKGKLNKVVLQENPLRVLDYLYFVAKIYEKIQNIYIDPEDVFFDGNEFHLADFKYKQVDPFEMILATLQWIYKTQIDPNKIMEQQFLKLSQSQTSQAEKLLEDCFIRKDQLQNSSSFPLYIRELWKNLVERKIQKTQLVQYIMRLKCKAAALSMKIDSFHACLHHKKTWTFQEQKHPWLIGKRFNELYFYNINDDHQCQVKVVRKKKKIDLSEVKLIFDPEQLQVKYIAENSKMIIHVSEFQLQKASCLSDIQIKHRIPIKFKNPFNFYNVKKQEIYILENCVYKYSVSDNKLFQQTKRIVDYIFLAKSYDFGFMVVKMSIDIFKNGIRVFVNQSQTDLLFVGQQAFLQEMANIRVDIRSVDFCKEIYKGVYIMLANRNMWVLDINFKVFFSYATVERVKSFYGFATVTNRVSANKGMSQSHQHHHHKHHKHSDLNHSDYAFQIFNQPFKAQFLPYQEGLNVKIKDDQMHIIGSIEGNMYYLKYVFLPEAGSLKLLEYKPLLGVDSTHQNDQAPAKPLNSVNSALKQTQNIQNTQDKVVKRVKISDMQTDFNQQSQSKPGSKLLTSIPNPKPAKHFQPRGSKQPNQLQALKYFSHSFTDPQNYQFYHFNFHQQNLTSYKTELWLFSYNPYFVKVEDFYLKTNKTNYEVQLKIKRMKCSLKDLIEKVKKGSEDGPRRKAEFTRAQCLCYMLRCLDIYEWLVKNQLFHRNLSIANLYFMKEDNALKLIGWSEPPRNWYVSDYKDLLLVFFNIITCSTFEKLTEKMLYKYKTELEAFSVINEKMQLAFKYMKISEKKGQIQKEIKEIREFLGKEMAFMFFTDSEKQSSKKQIKPASKKELSKQLSTSSNIHNSTEFIFNFQHNTPRFSMVSIVKNKMKKMKCLLDQNSKEELIFKSTDKYIWNEEKSCLYMFTASYQFYELKIPTATFKEQTLIAEEYEYLPHNILESTFIDVPGYGILSIGGIFKAKDSSLTFNKTVYQFNQDKLTWDPVFQIPEPRINPYLVLSTCGNNIYCIGGQVDHSSQHLSILKMSLESQKISQKWKITQYTDPLKLKLFAQVMPLYPTRIYNISEQDQLFVLFSITNQKYFVRIFSFNSFCIDLYLDTKNYSDDNKIIAPSVGIAFDKGTLHVLRYYGKYAKVQLNKLESLTVANLTIYPERDEKVEGN